MKTEQEEKIRIYVMKYANKHHISYEEAKEHLMCQLVSSFYEGDKKYEGNVISR